MGNSASHRIYNNIDVLRIIFEMLELKDQLNLRKINEKFYDFVIENIRNRLLSVESDFATCENNEFMDYLNKYSNNIRRINVIGHCEFYSWQPMKNLLKLNTITLNKLRIHTHDICWLIKYLENLKSLKLYTVDIENYCSNCKIKYNFTSKTLKQLRVPYYTELPQLLGSCLQNLEELTIDQAPDDICNLTIYGDHVTMANATSQIDIIKTEFQNQIYKLRFLYKIIAKRDGQLRVTLQSVDTLSRKKNVKNMFIENLHQLQHTEIIHHWYPLADTVKLFAQNCTKLRKFDCHFGTLPKGTINSAAFKNLQALAISNCQMSNQNIAEIIKYLNLKTLHLDCIEYSSPFYSYIRFPSDFESSLKNLKIVRNTDIFLKFFAVYEDIFKNLLELTFNYTDVTSSVMSALDKQQFSQLKALIIYQCYLEMPTKATVVARSINQINVFCSLTIHNCTVANGEYLQNLLSQQRLKHLNICHIRNGSADHIDHWTNSIKSITIDNLDFNLNFSFWEIYLENCISDLSFTVYDTDISVLMQLASNPKIQQRIKSIKFKNSNGKVKYAEELFRKLPVSVECLDPCEYRLIEYSFPFNKELESILQINF